MAITRSALQIIAAVDVADDLTVELTVLRGRERIMQQLTVPEAHQLAGELAAAAHEARRYQPEEPTA